MRIVPHILVTASLAWGLAGCSLFRKNTAPNTNGDLPPAPNNSAVPPPKFPVADPTPAPTPSGMTRGDTPGGTLLAGRVLDGTGRPPGNTSILVVRVDGKDEQTVGDVPLNTGDGHFTIPNLKAGGKYKLVARGKDGDRVVASTNYVTAPNPLVLIQMYEHLVTANTPVLPAPFDSLRDRKAEPFARNLPTPTLSAPNSTAPTMVADAGSWRPNGPASNAEFTLPAVHVPAPPANDPAVAQNAGTFVPPPLEIQRPRAEAPKLPAPPPIELAKIDPPTPKVPESLGAAKVPSCVLVGRTLVNFALNDLNGEPWEFRTNRTGKLVLLDFWGTWCAPCRQSLPGLKSLAQKYGPEGLEVVGIAYEQGGTPPEQAHRVNDLCQKLHVNYRQLLGSGPNCVVRSQLGVNGYPTMLLVDERGNIIWRHVGLLTTPTAGELERLIQTRLRTAS